MNRRHTAMSSRFEERERAREAMFATVWSDDLDQVFSEVADDYERANFYASLGLWGRLRERFVSTIELQPGQRVLDLCAGANALGIALLKREPGLELYAMDRSLAMQRAGAKTAAAQGFHIPPLIGDAHALPFPDNHFDVVTLQWATRHLRVARVLTEIRRILKPGGCFYNCDLSRPANRLLEEIYCLYLHASLWLTSTALGCGPTARKSRNYFVQAIRMFYSVEELGRMLSELGFSEVEGTPVMAGTVAYHKARKPGPTDRAPARAEPSRRT